MYHLWSPSLRVLGSYSPAYGKSLRMEVMPSSSSAWLRPMDRVANFPLPRSSSTRLVSSSSNCTTATPGRYSSSSVALCVSATSFMSSSFSAQDVIAINAARIMNRRVTIKFILKLFFIVVLRKDIVLRRD